MRRLQTKGGIHKRGQVITHQVGILKIASTQAGSPTANQCNTFFSRTMNSPGGDYTTGFSFTVNDVPRAITADGNTTTAIGHILASNVQAGDIVKQSYDATLGDIIDTETGNPLRSYTDYTFVNVL